jgi:hypothetical protein
VSARQPDCASRCHPFSVTQCALKPCPPLPPFLSSCSSFAPTPISSSIIHQHGLYVSLRIRESPGRILTLALFFLSFTPPVTQPANQEVFKQLGSSVLRGGRTDGPINRTRRGRWETFTGPILPVEALTLRVSFWRR